MDGVSLFQSIFESLNEALGILHLHNHQFFQVNAALEELTGYTQEELKTISLESLIYSKDLKKIIRRFNNLSRELVIQEELRFLHKGNYLKEVEINVRKIGVDDQEFILLLCKDTTGKKALEDHLQEEVQNYRNKMLEAAKGSVRLYHLMEKLRRVPRVLRELARITTEEELLAKAGQLFCSRSGLKYAAVAFLLREGDYLEVKFSSKGKPLRRFHVHKKHKFAEVARGEELELYPKTGESLIPFWTPEGNLGVAQVFFHEEERSLFMESEAAQNGQMDLLRLIIGHLSLLLSALRRRTAAVSASPSCAGSEISSPHRLLQYLEQMDYLSEGPFSVIYLAIDRFREIAQQYSYHLGDRLWTEVAHVLQACVSTGKVVHFCHDEFLLLLPQCTLGQANRQAEKIRHKMENRLFFPETIEHGLKITLSLGVVSRAKETPNAESLMKKLDEALHAAKAMGGNIVCTAEAQIAPVPKRTFTRLQ